MPKQFAILIATVFILFIVCFITLYILLKPAVEDHLLEVGSQSAYNALAIKTKFVPIKSSMSELMEGGNGYKVTSTNKTSTGLIFTLEWNVITQEYYKKERDNVLCILTFPNPQKGQYEATSRCWRLN
ncbi:unnamed protein product [Commensalibacter communis]|uniref:Uncharacterized protein n=1 Tax=Commensalibacter communis TaxID=2972786 RepID=A0A9W4TKS3_9PROT|nr:hypothetical protein [Commensalibacter communis]CAI3926299.1 unnamed protein product [Commensalibacter communis]CAI3926929.1 unnamed protein product [Commensalibacter communis]CAI3928463.1 unnamed protein product [Commensalibacter communis]CAI3934046.1 unnamed protein product [Commensalibacter communis]CAI3934556.1 unnamed protein product [Commensalibacter communis]